MTSFQTARSTWETAKGRTTTSISHFRRMAARMYRDARSSLEPHKDYETLTRLGREFKARAGAARARLARMRNSALQTKESDRQDLYRDRRE